MDDKWKYTEIHIIAVPEVIEQAVAAAFATHKVVRCDEAVPVPLDEHRIKVRMILKNP